MVNQFDQAKAFEGEPDSILVGSFVHWKRSDFTDPYPTAEYALEFTARSQNRKDEIKLTSTVADDGAFYFSASSATTSEWTAGTYYWQVEARRLSDDERAFLYRGVVEVRSDMDENAVDPRSNARRALDNINAVLENRVTKDVASYSIAGRSVTKIPFNELLDLRDYYRKEVAREDAIERVRNGRKSKTTVKVRFL